MRSARIEKDSRATRRSLEFGPRGSIGTATFIALTLILALGSSACVRDRPSAKRHDDLWAIARTELVPKMSDEEKAVRLAKWVSANSTNQPVEPGRTSVIPFFGLCGERAAVFLQLARRAGLTAQRVQYDRFVDSGHAAVQVSYDGDWHYFDVTYAGYFRTGEKILSLAEIRADPESAILGMVVFDFTHDRWTDGRAVDNHQRMRQNYRPEHVLGAVIRSPR